MTTIGRATFILLLAALSAACQSQNGETGIGSASEAATQLRVVTSGGFSAAYDLLAPQFEAESAIELVTSRGASSGGAPDSIPVRLARGEKFDVIILSRPALNDLAAEGYVAKGGDEDLAHSSIGMAVREGAPVPDISTPERFRQVLLDAESIGYSASASGTYLSTQLFPDMGLWPDIEAKSRRILSERVAAVVARGDVEIGFQQISEILPIEGARYVGPIPDEYQRVTTFSAATTASADRPMDAQRLISFLSSAEAAATIASTGLEPATTGR